MTSGLMWLSLLVLCAVGQCQGRVSAGTHTSRSDRSYQAHGVAFSHSMGPDGTEEAECAYSDSTGQRIRVRYYKSPNGEPQYTLVDGELIDPAEAFKLCVAASQQSNQMNSGAFPWGPASGSFIPFVGLGPVVGGFDGASAVGAPRVGGAGGRRDEDFGGDGAYQNLHPADAFGYPVMFDDGFRNIHQQIEDNHRRVLEQHEQLIMNMFG